jgi:phospholipid transport system substrate-binding protein
VSGRTRWPFGALIAGLFVTFGESYADVMVTEPVKVIVVLMDQSARTTRADLPSRQITAQLKQLLSDNFDIQAIARFGAGTHWERASISSQKEYVDEYANYMTRLYETKLGEIYLGKKLEMISARDDVPGRSSVEMRIPASPDNASVKVNWKLHQTPSGRWKITDVVVNEISMVITQRDEFLILLNRSGLGIGMLAYEIRSQLAVASASRR